MGNAVSGAAGHGSHHPWLSRDFEPGGQLAERARTLDAEHPDGYLRPALKLGDSFNFRQSSNNGVLKAPRVTGMRFHTEARAVERQSLGELKAEELLRKAAEQKQHAARHKGKRGACGDWQIAPWRVAMHQARRRTMLRVRTLVRLLLLSRRHMKQILDEPLVSHVPLVLRDQQGAFVQAMWQYDQLEAVHQYLQAALDGHAPAAGSAGSSLPPLPDSPRGPSFRPPPLDTTASHVPLNEVPTPHSPARLVGFNSSYVPLSSPLGSGSSPGTGPTSPVTPSTLSGAPRALGKASGTLPVASPPGSGGPSSPALANMAQRASKLPGLDSSGELPDLPERSSRSSNTRMSPTKTAVADRSRLQSGTAPSSGASSPTKASQSAQAVRFAAERPAATVPWDQLVNVLIAGSATDDLCLEAPDRSSAPAAFLKGPAGRSLSTDVLVANAGKGTGGAPSALGPAKSPLQSRIAGRLDLAADASLQRRSSVPHLTSLTADPPTMSARIKELRDKLAGGSSSAGQALLAAAEKRKRDPNHDAHVLNLAGKGAAKDYLTGTLRRLSDSGESSHAGSVGFGSHASGSTRTQRGASLPSLGTHAAGHTPAHLMDVDWAAGQVQRVTTLPVAQRRVVISNLIMDVKRRKDSVLSAMQSCLARCNAASVDRTTWNPPTIDATPSCPAWHDMDQHALWMQEAVSALQAGHIAVQLFADEDTVQLPEGGVADFWGLDPWATLAMEGIERPNAEEYGTRMEGICMGTRVLSQLLLLLEQCCRDPDAPSRVPIVLHIHDGQREQVEADILECSVYDRLVNRLIVIQHPRQHSFTFNPKTTSWTPVLNSSLQPVGEGLSMAQLTWPGQVLMMSRARGRLERAGLKSAMQMLQEWGAKWLVSWRSSDLHLVTPDPHASSPVAFAADGTQTGSSGSGRLSAPHHLVPAYAAAGHMLDPSLLGYVMWMHQLHGVACVIQADTARGAGMWRSTAGHAGLESGPPGSQRVLMQPHKKGRQLAGGLGKTMKRRDDEDEELEKLLNIQHKSVTTLRQVVELSGWRLRSPHMQSSVAHAAQAGLGGIMVGAQRYIFHLPTLATLLQSPLSVRPALRLSRNQLRVRLELSDLTADWRCTTMAVQLVGGRRRCLSSSQDMLGWAGLLAAQDAAMYELDERLSEAAAPSIPKAVAQATKAPAQQVRHHILVLLCDNGLASTCVAAAALVARAGVDCVHLLMLVNSDASKADAEAFLAPHATALRDAGLRADTMVESKEHVPASEALAAAATRCAASLVVVGSVQLTAGSSAQHQQQLVSDSFTLFVLHVLSLPTLVVTTHCKLPAPATTPYQSRPPTRSLMLVEGHSRPLLHYLCGLLSPGGSGPNDLKLYLAQVYNPKACSTALCSSLRLLSDKFSHIAGGHSMNGAQTVRLDPPCHTALLTAVKEHMLHLLAVQLPSDVGQDAAVGARYLPAHLLAVLRGSAVPVLVYPRRHAAVQHAAVPQGLSALLHSGSKVFLPLNKS